MRSAPTSLFIVFVFLSTIFHACSKEEYLPGLTGNMIGFVYTFDEFGNYLNDPSNVKVTAFGMDQNYSTHSNSKGRFVLEEVPTGTYELHLKKEGFGTMKQFGVQHLGGKPTILLNNRDKEEAFILYEMPATVIEYLHLVDDSLTGEFTFGIPHPISSFHLRVYFSSSDNFDRKDAEYIENTRIWYTDGTFWGRFYFDETPFDPGETVYYKACRYTKINSFYPPYQSWYVSGVHTYYDYELNETIYPNLGDESEQYSFTFPE